MATGASVFGGGGRAGQIAAMLREPPAGEEPPVLPAEALTTPQPEGHTPAQLIGALLSRERARQRLIDFATFVDDTYCPYPVHRLIAEKLEAVESGRVRRLAIFVPPASGKSRLASELFPAWFLGRNPRAELIQTSYDHDLATEFGRQVRNLLRHPRYGLVFPEVGLSADATAADSWKTEAGGEYKAEGVGGGLVGFHGVIAILDDPVKDYAAAASGRAREALWTWYTGTLLNRLRSYKDGPGAVILIMQRWHDDDLGGRLEKLAESGEEEWDVLRLPSLAEEGDPLGRPVGTPLLPEGPNQRSAAELRALQSRNPRLFMALHQQKPVGDTGDRFRKGWLQPYGPAALPRQLSMYLTTDFAMSEGAGDYTVLVAAGVCPEGHVWLVDLWRAQCGVMAGVEQAVAMMGRWKVGKYLLERTAMAKAYGPLLAKRKAEEEVWAVEEMVSILGRGGKDDPDRAGVLAGAMELGYFHAPLAAPWLGELEYELMRFPNGRHDDQVDALVLLALQLNVLRRAGKAKGGPVGPVELRPACYTFDQAREVCRRKRLGRPVRPRSIVLPFPGQSVLDAA